MPLRGRHCCKCCHLLQVLSPNSRAAWAGVVCGLLHVMSDLLLPACLPSCRRVVAALRAKGVPCRALVRDRARAANLLPQPSPAAAAGSSSGSRGAPEFDIVTGDVYQYATLPGALKGCNAGEEQPLVMRSTAWHAPAQRQCPLLWLFCCCWWWRCVHVSNAPTGVILLLDVVSCSPLACVCVCIQSLWRVGPMTRRTLLAPSTSTTRVTSI